MQGVVVSPKSNNFLELSGINNASSLLPTLTAESFPILKDLSPLSLRILNDAARLTHVSKGVEMLHEDNPPHDLAFIQKGKISIAKQQGSQLKMLAQLGPGNLYGEFGILRKKTRLASVFTAEPCEIIRIEQSAVQQVLDSDPDFKTRLTDLLLKRMLSGFFSSHPLFKDLPTQTRAQLAKHIPVQFHHRNSNLLVQGGKPTGIYIILSGEVEVSHLNSQRQEILLEIRRDDDMLGELAANNGTALAYSATVSSDLDVLCFDPTTMKKIHTSFPQLFVKLEQYINKRAERTSQHLKSTR